MTSLQRHGPATRRTTASERSVWTDGQRRSEVFPYRVREFDLVIENLTIFCACCGTRLGDDYVRFRVTDWPTSVDIRAMGVCLDCRQATWVQRRYHDDMTMTCPAPDGSGWQRFVARRTPRSPWARLQGLVSRFWSA